MDECCQKLPSISPSPPCLLTHQPQQPFRLRLIGLTTLAPVPGPHGWIYPAAASVYMHVTLKEAVRERKKRPAGYGLLLKLNIKGMRLSWVQR